MSKKLSNYIKNESHDHKSLNRDPVVLNRHALVLKIRY